LCGIAGYSLSDSSRVDPTLATQILLAAISERGSDAAGYCYRGPGVELTVHKQRSGASRLLDSISVPHRARQGLIHVRDYTKGHPSIEANNHPIRHGSVVGIHNGIIRNDEEIFSAHGFERAAPRMTVDSEAIFALMEARPSSVEALNELYGSMATAWMDERTPEVVHLARGMGRPLWIGQGREALFFASTEAALERVESYAGVSLEKCELETGTLVTVTGGTVSGRDSFQPDLAFSEKPLPAVRAPEEHRSCLALLAALAAPAAAARAAAR
jgi:glucosamine 6-phosphate synthetase-like amidotransferase/phosphosugar isomerase protein